MIIHRYVQTHENFEFLHMHLPSGGEQDNAFAFLFQPPPPDMTRR